MNIQDKDMLSNLIVIIASLIAMLFAVPAVVSDCWIVVLPCTLLSAGCGSVAFAGWSQIMKSEEDVR